MKVGELLKVTRDDIQDFPGDTIQLIMDLQKDGWRAQRSNRNHVMLLAPDGVTKYSASRNANSAKYLSEDIARYNRGDKHPSGENLEHTDEEVAVPAHEKFPCPHADCPKFYASQEKVNVHVAVDHEGYLKCPDCDDVFKRPAGLGLHRANKHGYESPTKSKRKKQREVKENLKKLVEPDMVPQRLRDGEKFDPHFVEQLVEKDVIPVKDVMDIHHITPKEGSLKGLVTSSTEFDPPLEFAPSETFVQQMSEPVKISNAEIYRQTRAQLVAGVDPEVVRTADLEFIDSRDSWVLDHYEIANRRIGTLEQILDAVGLRMEIRVWKP